MATKYIFVTGGVVSSLGKGITAASLGRLLKDRGFKVSMQKFDPYINVNPGYLSPYQHGEVFVTKDGAECDLDVGHYERFIDENLGVDSDVTTGQIYESIIRKERAGDYQGSTVQVIPHVTNEIKKRIYRIGRSQDAPDIVITEIGGTVGDIESLPYLEAIRQMSFEVGHGNCLFIHVTLVPFLGMAGELKTKPTQHSVKELRSIGIQPDFIVCRCEMPLPKALRDKIGLFCNLPGECVIPNLDVATLYEVPLKLEEAGMGDLVCSKLMLESQTVDQSAWRAIVDGIKNPSREVRVALVGKYVELRDAYLSVSESLMHAGIYNNARVEVEWIQAAELETGDAGSLLKGCHAILTPGGFGERAAEGKVRAAQYARENGIPFLGIGMGMQMAVVEFARNVMGLAGANSTEMEFDAAHPIISLMSDQKELDNGTMRLGDYACRIKPGTLAYKAYGTQEVHERHRHRYEFNNQYREQAEAAGLICAGVNTEHDLVEIVELKGHEWFVGVQFHPEFQSRPNRAHPLFMDFVAAALRYAGKQ